MANVENNVKIIKSGAYLYKVNIDTDVIETYGVKDVEEKKGDGLKFIDVTGRTAKEFLESLKNKPQKKFDNNKRSNNKNNGQNKKFDKNKSNNNKNTAKKAPKADKKLYRVQYSKKTIYRSDSLEAYIVNKTDELFNGKQLKQTDTYKIWASWQNLLPSNLGLIDAKKEVEYEVKYDSNLVYITVIDQIGEVESERTVRNPFRNEIVRSVCTLMKPIVNHLVLPCNPSILEAVPEDHHITVLLPESLEKLMEYCVAIGKDHDYRRTIQKSYDTVKEKLQKQFDKKVNISIELISDESMDKLIQKVKKSE